MAKEDPVFRITKIEQNARSRYDAAIASGDMLRALILGRWLVKLNKIGDRICFKSIEPAV